MATKDNVAPNQKVVDAAQRIRKLMPDDESWTPRHVMILVNVAGKAEELRAEGKSREEITDRAAEFGKRIAFEARDERFYDLPQKAAQAARLFMNDRQLALDVCEAFIQIRIEHRKSAGLDDDVQRFEVAYKEAMQEIVKAIESSGDLPLRTEPTPS